MEDRQLPIQRKQIRDSQMGRCTREQLPMETQAFFGGHENVLQLENGDADIV